MKVAKISNFFLISLLSFTASCCKDIEKLMPINECRIISNYSRNQGYWRYINYNSSGEIISYVDPDYSYNVIRNLTRNELMVNKTLDTGIYKRIDDTILYSTTEGKVLKKIILQNNLIVKFIDSQDNHAINYEYKDGTIIKETRGSTKFSELLSVRSYTYDDTDLIDFHDLGIGERYVISFENRLVADFFKLDQKFKRYRKIDMVLYNLSNGTIENRTYDYSYITNDRNLITHKIISETKRGLFKDTVSYTYTCKY
jgi:hypothetical protein